MDIHSMDYQTKADGIGTLYRPVSRIYGLQDAGMVALMSDIADEGAEELIFTCASADFESGDTAKITYTDTDEGYAQVTLPLHAISVTISAAASGGTDAVTGEVLTTLTVASSTGLVAGLGLTITQLTGTDTTYISQFRIHSVVNATSIKIVKSYVALSGTIAGVTDATLIPVSTIASVESLVYTSLPGRTLVKDADDILYAILPTGDGVSQYRRYECPQVDTASSDTDEWTVIAIVKRAFTPLTETSDLVYLDSIPALTAAFLSIVARDAGDHDREAMLWNRAIKILDKELADNNGGVKHTPNFQPWGRGVGSVPSLY